MTGSSASSTHPPLPPTTEEDRLARLRLLRSRRVGAVTWWRLMREHGGADAALAALPAIARAAGVADYSPCPEGVVHAELAAGRTAGARLVLHGDADYPAGFADMANAPPALWVRGDPGLLGRPMVSLVGARNASSLGLRMARMLAAGLGQAGQVVVSGLARGIDAAAHEAALATGTLAVLAGGVDRIYPQEHASLADRIIGTGGALVSEQPMGLAPQARHFPARNRIVAGLARGVVVVEGALRSGSLITAREALDLGRDVMAVPGHPLDARAGGCNALLRDGATLVRDAGDVIAALVPGAGGTPALACPEPQADTVADDPPSGFREPPARPPGVIASLHQQILDRLGPVPVTADDVIRDLGAPARLVSPAFTELELAGRIQRMAGGRLTRPG